MSQAAKRNDLIRQAVQQADETRAVEVGTGVLQRVPDLLRQRFGDGNRDDMRVILVADTNTWRAAGERVAALLADARIQTAEPVILDVPDLHATSEYVDQVEAGLKQVDAIPVAVGSGTINDLTKLASHNVNRPYMAVGTAASMDGYTAFGASIVYENAKQTKYCPAPRAVVADMDILAAAPPIMNAAGYGDLLAKVVAGADWLIADALEIELIHQASWDLTQTHLHDWVSLPEAVKNGDPEALADLTLGLIMTGFGMQSARSSRPASGAEHQFSHLWDMQHHTHQGRIPLHGCKVSIGLLVSTLMHEQLLATDMASLDVPTLVKQWPTLDQVLQQVEAVQTNDELLEVARTECREKYVDAATLSQRLTKLQAVWPELRPKIFKQLIPFEKARAMLRAVGAPSCPTEIGIDMLRMQKSFAQAQQIRRRFTILDVAMMLGCLNGWANACTAKLG